MCVTLTVHKSLQALHQGFDRIRQVPRVLLDVLVNDAAATNRKVLRLSKLCSHETQLNLKHQFRTLSSKCTEK